MRLSRIRKNPSRQIDLSHRYGAYNEKAGQLAPPFPLERRYRELSAE